MVIPGTIIRPLLAALGACWALSAAAVDIHAYTEDVPPLNYVDKGKISGYSTEVLRLAAQEAGLSLSIEAQPWLRAYAAVQKSPNALLFTVVRTPEREAQFQWVGPIDRAASIYTGWRRAATSACARTTICGATASARWPAPPPSINWRRRA